MLDENSSKLKAERLKAKGRRLGSLEARMLEPGSGSKKRPLKHVKHALACFNGQKKIEPLRR
jgi:hypothetical protein